MKIFRVSTVSVAIATSMLCSIAIAAEFGKPLVHKLSTFANSPSLVTASGVSFEVKGRTGSKRVGGSNSKGKGSRYVGGRK